MDPLRARARFTEVLRNVFDFQRNKTANAVCLFAFRKHAEYSHFHFACEIRVPDEKAIETRTLLSGTRAETDARRASALDLAKGLRLKRSNLNLDGANLG